MSLELLLATAFSGSLFTYILGKISSKLRENFAVLLSLALVVMIACLYGKSMEGSFYSGFFDLPFILRINVLSWFFAIAISGLGALSVIFSLSYMKDRERTSLVTTAALLCSPG